MDFIVEWIRCCFGCQWMYNRFAGRGRQATWLLCELREFIGNWNSVLYAACSWHIRYIYM